MYKMQRNSQKSIQYEDLAFTNIGVDFAGPLYVRDIYDKSKRMHKCYIALFSCANTRALHLEFIPSLKVDPFICKILILLKENACFRGSFTPWSCEKGLG